MTKILLHHQLFEAVRKGEYEEVEKIIDEGADLKATSTFGDTFLHFAAMEGRTEVAELLIKKGCYVATRDKIGRTPLYWAEICKHKKTAKLIKRYGGR